MSRPYLALLVLTCFALGQPAAQGHDPIPHSPSSSSLKRTLSQRILHSKPNFDPSSPIKGKNKTYEIEPEHRNAPLGKGIDGTVYKGRDAQTNEPVALKVLERKAEGPARKDQAEKIRAEVENLKVMGQYHGEPIKMKDKIVVPMKYIEGKTLKSELIDPKSPHDSQILMKKARSTLDDLHQKGYSHGDAHSGNFIVSPKGDVHIIDFSTMKKTADPAASDWDDVQLENSSSKMIRHRIKKSNSSLNIISGENSPSRSQESIAPEPQ